MYKKEAYNFWGVILVIAVGIYFYLVSTRIYGNDTEPLIAIISSQKKIKNEV